MSRTGLSLALMLLAAGAAHAAEPGPRALALARRYVAAVQAQTILENEGPAIAAFIISRMPPPPGGEARAEEVKHAMLDAANAAVAAKTPEFLDKTAAVYATLFTEKELADIVAFYDSPAGKAFVAKTKDAAAPMAAVIHDLGAEIQQDTQQRFCAKEADLCKAADAGR
jgi:hypothetical protein